MKLTTDHPASSRGVPVFISGETVLDYSVAIKDLLRIISQRSGHYHIPKARKELSEAIGFSVRTIQGWEDGRKPSVSALIAMQKSLKSYLVI